MSSTPRAVLIELFEAYGRPLLNSPRILEGLLKDYCGDFRREIFVLVSCAKAGVPEQLLHQSGPSIKLVCARLALKLEQNLATSGDIARWAVETWAIALGLLTPDGATPRLSNTIGLFAGASGQDLHNMPPAAATTKLPLAEELPGAKAAVDDTPILAEDDAIEVLAEEPDSRWPVPDWAHPEDHITVFPDDAGQTPTLREAVNDAPNNACILLRPGVYRESLVIKRNLQLRAADTLRGATIESLTNASVVVLDGASLFLCHLKMKGVPGEKDARALPAVEVKAGHLVMEDCDLTSEAATVVEVRGSESEAILRRCHIHDGKAGGITFQDASAGYLEDCHLYRNKLSQVVIGKGCAPTLTGCKISHSAMAGVYISEAGAGLIEDCDIWGSEVGGIQCRRGGNPRVRLCRISMNERYGVLVAEQGEGLFEHCKIFDNARGVTVSQQAQPRFSFCQIFDNRGEGVEIAEQGAGEWLDCEIFSNQGANVSVKEQSTPGFYRCVLHDGRREGALVATMSEPRFERCEFFAHAQAQIFFTQESSPLFDTCVVHDGEQSGVIAREGARGRFVNCELTHHAAPAIVVGSRAEPQFETCHLFENEAAAVEVEAEGAPRFTGCAICDNQGAGIVVHTGGAGSAVNCDVAKNIGGDWQIDSGARFSRVGGR